MAAIQIRSKSLDPSSDVRDFGLCYLRPFDRYTTCDFKEQGIRAWI